MTAAIAEEKAALEERWASLLDRTESWVAMIGGWSLIRARDIARIAMHLDSSAWSGNLVNADTDMSYFLKRQAKRGQLASQQVLDAVELVSNEIEGSDDPRGRFFELLREATGAGLTPILPGQDWPFTVELIELTGLFADDAYQRPVDENFVRELVLKFDERLVGTIDVSQRKGRKSMAMMDGRQRHAACGAIGKTAMWCNVYTGLSLADEARFFHHKNRDRKNVHPYYHFNARLVAGDTDAEEINTIVTRHGFVLGTSASRVDTITSIVAVESVFGSTTSVRDNALDPALEKLNRLWWGVKGGKDGSVIRGFGRFFAVFSDEEVEWRHLEDQLAALGPMILQGRAKEAQKRYHQSGQAIGTAIARVMVEIHNTGLPRGKRLNVDRVLFGTPRPQ